MTNCFTTFDLALKKQKMWSRRADGCARQQCSPQTLTDTEPVSVCRPLKRQHTIKQTTSLLTLHLCLLTVRGLGLDRFVCCYCAQFKFKIIQSCYIPFFVVFLYGGWIWMLKLTWPPAVLNISLVFSPVEKWKADAAGTVRQWIH